MGFDISYHPISKAQMKLWYFERLHEVENENYDMIHKLGRESGVEECFIEKYIETMKVAIEDKQDIFGKTHIYYLAVVQGFFQKYFYTRGTPISFLIEENPDIEKYITSWRDIKPDFINCLVTDSLAGNYSGGIYISPKQVKQLLSDLNHNNYINEIFNKFFATNISVFINALKYANEHDLGLIEASEVVEPNPIDLNNSICYSNLLNCDIDGALIYRDIALKQIAEAIKEDANKEEKKGLFRRVFGKISKNKLFK